ncbi:hypothetical protein PUV54_08260 [Hyphococcus flavus]|uniref:AMP-dependent synthetase/ligase domain-containing protein n=1 Tax=Hyphococcus flavus TaxID=1866326 RepID=A0AAE9ZDT8_9PROT|nr:hypothetical protein [Hyphococcus flavus]WDI33189.1 hypothetical protein PUV54_08260 [Hyphococcus flavus]
MKSFSLSQDQISRIVGAAVADELSRRFNRHIDFLTAASWNGAVLLGQGGASLSPDEKKYCGQRVAQFFGLNDEYLNHPDAIRLDDWSALIKQGVVERLERFSFKPAARNAEDSAFIHNADEIFQDAAAAANILYGRRRLLSFVAPHSLLGLELSILTPNLLGIETIDARGMTPESLSKNLLFGDVLVATPTLWRYMMQERLKAPDNTLAVSFGEPMTPDLAIEMRNSGFGVLRELYGSTETGLIAWRDTPGDAFVLFDHWGRDGDGLKRTQPDGTSREVQSMDILTWVGPSSFRLAGRRDGAVQIGAVNVFPEAVAQTLEEHHHIESCRVLVGRRSDGASRLIAHIVLKNSALPNEKTAREIDAWCKSNLRQQERPQIYNFESTPAA